MEKIDMFFSKLIFNLGVCNVFIHEPGVEKLSCLMSRKLKVNTRKYYTNFAKSLIPYDL